MFLVYLLFLRITVPINLIQQLLLKTLKMQPHHVNKKLIISPLLFVLQEYFVATPSMHGIAAITGNMHRSLRYFVLLERITSYCDLLKHEVWCYQCPQNQFLDKKSNNIQFVLDYLPHACCIVLSIISQNYCGENQVFLVLIFFPSGI